MSLNDVLDSVITEKNDNNVFETQARKISCNFDVEDETLGLPNIKILGIGGAGNNIIDYLGKIRSWPLNVNFWAMNTDRKTLIRLKKNQFNSSLFLIGENELKGFGSGGDPVVGKKAFEENKNDVSEILSDADIVFIIAGLGKGTGSGVGPEIAKIAKEKNILTISIVTLPSVTIEGEKIYEIASESYQEMNQNCDSICAISNDKIISNNGETEFFTQLEKGNKEIGSIISDFVNIISNAGRINIDFRDLKSFLKESKYFLHTIINIEKGIQYEALQQKIASAIDKSYSNWNFSLNEINIIANFKMNQNTNASVIIDTRKILEQYARNPDIKFIYGIEDSISEEAEVSLFISNADQNHQNVPQTTEVISNKVEEYISKEEVEKVHNTKKITKKLFDLDLFDDEDEKTNEDILTKVINEGKN
ncbi:MAG: cell division FtsZ family protein [Mycoplasmataceae bacterium]|nr:cell division FtsZ family protein [Mycoplasmataceae bacterium]